MKLRWALLCNCPYFFPPVFPIPLLPLPLCILSSYSLISLVYFNRKIRTWKGHFPTLTFCFNDLVEQRDCLRHIKHCPRSQWPIWSTWRIEKPFLSIIDQATELIEARMLQACASVDSCPAELGPERLIETFLWRRRCSTQPGEDFNFNSFIDFAEDGLSYEDAGSPHFRPEWATSIEQTSTGQWCH